MAVFLVNQCTFSKLPSVNNDEQSVNSTGLPSSNICGLKFDSLFELIHHIEDNHINDVEYSGIAGPFYNGPQRQMQPIYSQGYDTTGNISTQQPMMNSIYPSGPYNIVPHDRNHMTQIINGGWLPTSCVLRIFNTTQKKQPPNNHQMMHTMQAPQHHLQQIKYEPGIEPHLQQPMVPMQPPQGMVAVQQPMSMAQMTVPQTMSIQQPIPVQQTMPVQQQMPIQQQLTVDMMSPSPQLCTTPIDNSHHIILTSPKIVGTSLNGTSFHVTSGAITTMAPQQPTLQPQAQTQPQPQQQSQPMSQPQQQLQPQSQPQMQQLQTQAQQQPMQAQTQPNPSLTNAPPAPVKTVRTYKCADCNKTYKTLHGMRSHQSQVHPNSPHVEPKAMIVMSESGDTPTGSPAPLSQAPIQVINSPQPTASSISNSNSIQQQTNQTMSSTPKPTKVYKCADCNKTYKTQHGMRTHQNQVHPNSPHVDVKTMAVMPEIGDTPTGSPADLPQQQGKIAPQ